MIVLHTTKYGDSSLVVHGYTEEGGRESFLFRGKGKSLLHPLCIIEYTSSDNRRGTLKYLKEFTPKYGLDSIRSNLSKSSIAIFVSEVLFRSLLLSQKDAELYGFIESSILKLNAAENNFSNFHLWFLVNYASRLGFSPRIGFEGEYNPFSEKEKMVLERLYHDSYSQAMEIPMTGEGRTAFLSSFLKYLDYHLGIRMNIKSLKILHSVNFY